MSREIKKKRSKSVTFNLYEEEYNRLEQVALENGCTVSQAARWLLFVKKGGVILKDSQSPCTEMTCRDYLDAYKKNAKIFSVIAAKIERLTPESDDRYVRQLFIEAKQLLKDSRDILTSTFVKLNVPKEILDDCKNIPIPTSEIETDSAKKTDKTTLKKYFYMQRITICGSIAADAETFTAKNGSELTSFTVICDEKGEKTNYDIYASKYIVADILPLLKARRQVFVTGNFRIRSVTSKSGMTQNPLSVSADSITLGMEELA